MNRWRYARGKSRTALVIAGAMTAMVSVTVWMLANAFQVRHADWWTLVSALVFFGFVSAAMVVRYLRGETVLAVLPTGLYDARWRADPVGWEAIREVVLRRRENEVELDIYLWKPQAGATAGIRPERTPDHTIELAPLDGAPGEIVRAIAAHAPLRTDDGLGAGPGIEPVRVRGQATFH